MGGWQSRVEDLLYENESVQEVVDIDTARVVVTSHRVLTFTPEMDGENFKQVERPNVVGVGTSAQANTTLAAKSIRYGIYGGLFILAGHFINFEGFVGDIEFDAEAAGETGAGGMIEIAQQMMDFMAVFDEIMQMIGSLVLLVAVAIFAVYWLLRDETLVIQMAGDEQDIHVPRPDDVDVVSTRLEDAIFADVEQQESGLLSSVMPDDLL